MTALLLVCALVVLVAFAKSPASKAKAGVIKPAARRSKTVSYGRKAARPKWSVPDYATKSSGTARKVHELHDLWHHERNVKFYIAARRNGREGVLHRPTYAEMNLTVTGNHPVSARRARVGDDGIMAVFVDDVPQAPVQYQVQDYTRWSVLAVKQSWINTGVGVVIDDDHGGYAIADSTYDAAVVRRNSGISHAGDSVDAGGTVGVILMGNWAPPPRPHPSI
jgi:hypothetical protein